MKRIPLFIGLALMMLSTATHAQRGRKNLPNFDSRLYHFGFILSANSSDFNFAVADSASDSFRGVNNVPQAGFNMHLMASYTLTRHLRVRFVPGLSFQERALLYRFAGNAEQLERTSAVNLDVPLLIKWRTDRMTNVAAYALGGVKYLRDFQSQEDVRQEEDILRLRSGNVALDLGAGIDIFLPCLLRILVLTLTIAPISIAVPETSPSPCA